MSSQFELTFYKNCLPLLENYLVHMSCSADETEFLKAESYSLAHRVKHIPAVRHG